MAELFVPFFLFLILLAPIASFVWQFRRVQRGVSSQFKGIVLYAGYSTVPVLVYFGIFLASLGIEELLNTSLISEGYARSLLIIGIGGTAMVIVGTVIFSIIVVFIKDKR